ncbi:MULTISPECIES: MarR family winged helix-turn-helix transcriptional regulator [Marivita]|uniref:MarR family transcriptional regulator n=1 Tax=Marivita cryptomonadis TaxID=505252 RepID=A0A9Q2RY62_9RHOB|nr:MULTISPECIES: MarR family transcriptional regulator [Marivita]MCR9167443.1 MarR family transcriptional regulator [Paracoccaceae bacterium]MBM2322562.1 MarR family transcriptional regulator [Marivita cryptomonadis]MBM2332144.1 MarR family transcriptional regulator [Marivita cryptomonadis]MBM2341728.1 MarR family transcriptional regulator [Marivita cryptomonadis]MBM2346392.1 MarR family transcriptional regulator [Marivita cryptomonadis]
MKPEQTNMTEPMSKARLRLWLQLLKLSSGIEGELRRRLRDRHDTTLPRFDVMAALARHRDGLKMSDLSRYLKVSNGNVTGIVDRLVEEGLALRVAVPGDRRANLARLTPKGEAAFADLAAQHEAWIDELLTPLTDTDTQSMIGLLKKAMTQEARHGSE